MIKAGEIQQKAIKVGVRDQQIEKDYILSWLIFGFSKHEFLSKAAPFKGGTVLKKAYFDDYRFSEDLDFTLLDKNTENDKIFEWFKETFEFIKEESNITLEITKDNEHEDGGINFYVNYVGPLGGQSSKKKVKVDISRNELLVFEPVMKNIFIGYSDLKQHSLLCYPLEEILVEKMRSVMQRMQARDFYDIWYLLEVHQMEIDYCLSEFKTKCQFKDLQASEFPAKLIERIPQYKGRWLSSLQGQIKDLPDFSQVERETLRHIKKLKF